ncbi:hypothetical protein HPB50_027094 [Hyalomma asiaticum]|uniref:Uncharacterized protein n=1 Tax=Hyalomma asiaticum TaxID=266040 RepID=A0ACB7SZR0_HYAAI|nr:hypothetical protein HPB50_027094 [Hyalomma asiaticum]
MDITVLRKEELLLLAAELGMDINSRLRKPEIRATIEEVGFEEDELTDAWEKICRERNERAEEKEKQEKREQRQAEIELERIKLEQARLARTADAAPPPPAESRRLAPATECFFPTPHRGQSLTSFLSSADFGTCLGELDRENAHIYVSEALIAAFEQMRCSRAIHDADDDDESDEEIAHLRQRIRIRRKERLRERALQYLNEDGSWCCAEATTSTSPLSSAYSSPCFQGVMFSLLFTLSRDS